ncbi:MAG TPA: hypothetical protein VMH28_10390 [Candidatus Acidoferrales bacterium]|nr:hypothetical protein [Candidatus Acidoferrales bacterium]
MPVAVIALVIVAALITAVVLLVRNLGSNRECLPVTAEWIDELSVERYRPMMRLLDSSDLEFLRYQPGYSRRMESNLRAQRCQIFSGYLRCLNLDFRRICMALKLLMVQSRQDRPDLASSLLQHQIMFATGMLGLRLRLFLYRWGGCTVDARSLVQVFDVMRLELRGLVPSAISA